MVEFMEKLKELRLYNKLTQEELAKEIGVHPKTISKWERGVLSPNIESLVTLVRYFDVKAGVLIGTE